MAMRMNAKKIFPLVLPVVLFVALLVTQMSIHGSSSSASRIELGNEKTQAYQARFAQLSLESTRGSKYKLSEVSQPIVILNFWASWCRPCLSEFRSLTKLIEKFGADKILVLGVNNDSEDQLKAIKKTENDLNLNFESVADKDSLITESFFINEIPASIVFHKGKVIHFENKEFDFMDKKFLAEIEKALGR